MGHCWNCGRENAGDKCYSCGFEVVHEQEGGCEGCGAEAAGHSRDGHPLCQECIDYDEKQERIEHARKYGRAIDIWEAENVE